MRYFRFAALGAFCLTSITSVAADADPTLNRIGADLCAEGKQRSDRLAPLMNAAPEGAVNPNDLTDLLHNDINIEIDPTAGELGGSNTMTVRSLVDGLSTFQVRLDDEFAISSVAVDTLSSNWVRLDDRTIEITLPAPVAADQTFEVFVDYAGDPESLGFGSINFTMQAGTPVVFTLSEPWFSFTWWPNKDDNRDKATADLRFTAPSWMSIASNGLLQSETDLGDGRATTHWSAVYPMTTYLHSFAATNYTRFSDVFVHDEGVMPLEFYIYPQSDTPNNRDRLLRVIPMLDVFGDLFGPYPFIDEKYGIYQFNFGGGMEHQTMTGQGGFGESLTAHELAHQWWGDMITCATWSDIWLNEGFATYSEALWLEFKNGQDTEALHEAMSNRRPGLFDGSTYVFDPIDPSRIFSSSFTYRKGAWILHMLRYVIGDDAFFDSLIQYRQAHEYGSAITADYQSIVESITGEDISWYFDQWVFGVGAPWYEHAWTMREVAGQQFVEVMVRQAQPEHYNLFTMPIEVHIDSASMSTRHVLDNNAPLEHFLIPVDATATDVIFDPDTRILAQESDEVAFIDGPPKIVGASPAPGSELSADSMIHVTFHVPVDIDASDILLTSPAGDVSMSLSYDAGGQTATITPNSPLPAGEYTLTVMDTVTALTGGASLDGETTDAIPGEAFITGDGEPGGHAVFAYTVAPANSFVDFNGDGTVDGADLATLLASWGACANPPCANDLNDDGVVNGADLATLLANWGKGG